LAIYRRQSTKSETVHEVKVPTFRYSIENLATHFLRSFISAPDRASIRTGFE
jgi:hypothetical protein